MSVPNSPIEVADERVPADLVEAGVYPTFTSGCEHGLVVLAMGQAYWLAPSDHGHRLLVEPQVFEAARDQLACYDRESIGWPPRPFADYPVMGTFEFITPLLWSLVILATFQGQARWPGWTDAGALDASAVFDRGEWWRVFTALFLHADRGHLVSNALSGIFVFSAVLSTVGRGKGWLLLLIASVAGTLATAAVNYPGPYHSIGASTAIFAAVGLLTGRAIRVARAAHRSQHWRGVFVPLAAGLTILGIYGAGGLHIDVGAHLAGFSAGLVLGMVAARGLRKQV